VRFEPAAHGVAQPAAGADPGPEYAAEEFDRMVGETCPDTVIVTTIDSTHHIGISTTGMKG
jgi:hypothetical protein